MRKTVFLLLVCMTTAALDLFSAPPVVKTVDVQKIRGGGTKKAEDMDMIYFPKIRKYDIGLEVVSLKRKFKAGQPAVITLRLKSFALKRLVVYEWLEKESDNISLFWIPWHGTMKKPKKEDWFSYIPKIEKKPKRMPLTLEHRNSVLIDVKIPFIEKIKGLNKAQDFVVFAELNLSSISAKSDYIKITVTP